MTAGGPPSPPDGPGPPPEVLEAIDGIAPFAAGMANVVMQLSRLPIGHGVAESRVHGGRIDEHPLKRLRATITYLIVALVGSESERRALRQAINRVHAQVRSRVGDPVAYDAFDPELQLWVAACLYQGLEQCHAWLHGPVAPGAMEAFYRHGRRFGTTLQVPEDSWPADREAFEDYWQAGVRRIEMDELTRAYLRDLVRLGFLPTPARQTLGTASAFLTMGFLPAPFRAALGLPWSARRQRAFETLTTVVAHVNRRLPDPVRRFPLNACLWGFRRRLHSGRPLV